MRYKIFIFMLSVLTFYGCKKDLGNYTYNPPSEPMLPNFADATFEALVGDTLTLRPYVQIDGADPLKDLSFKWEIIVAEEARTDVYTGYPLKMVYNLSPMLRSAKLTVTDNRNGIQYFYPFKIQGGTQFSHGMTVLSVENGVTKLSFIKPDGIVFSNLYYSLEGKNLPANPLQLYAKPIVYQQGSVEDYWVVAADSTVLIDGNTLLRKKSLAENFFRAPAELSAKYFDGTMGIPTGVINNKLYLSITSTAPFAPDFGKFSNPQAGDYTMSPYYTRNSSYYFGYDIVKKAFISFDGNGSFMGSDYAVIGNAFNPKNTGLGDLLFMRAVSGTTYAFFKSADGTTVNELSFLIDMNNYDARKIEVNYKRVFPGNSFVKADTKWQRSPVNIFYFTSEDRIYRYNPVNDDLLALEGVSGKKISMIQLNGDGTELTVGVEGTVKTYDVSRGDRTTLLGEINGIPGSPVDVVIRD